MNNVRDDIGDLMKRTGDIPFQLEKELTDLGFNLPKVKKPPTVLVENILQEALLSIQRTPISDFNDEYEVRSKLKDLGVKGL
jgi:hypothetical protein